MDTQQEYLDKMAEMVVEMEDEDIADVCQEYIDKGFDPKKGIFDGLIRGMTEANKLYDEEEYFITDVLLCSDAMYAGLNVLEKYVEISDEDILGVAVIGVVEGDTHDIGKNLVKLMMETAGFKMIDLGRDVKLQNFIDAAVENNADLICMSTLMTTTMENMGKVIEMLKEQGLRDRFKVMIGG
ncbi:MAG: corrinoid protein, partial [Finegoldia magna]|nr:corrinoid protein [Finegoldia magna]